MGSAIRQKRVIEGHSQEVLADMLADISRSQLAYFELGTRTPSPEQLEEIAIALDTDVNSLLYADEDEGSHAVINKFPACLTEHEFIEQEIFQAKVGSRIVMVSPDTSVKPLGKYSRKYIKDSLEDGITWTLCYPQKPTWATSLFSNSLRKKVVFATPDGASNHLSLKSVAHTHIVIQSGKRIRGFERIEYSKYHRNEADTVLFVPLSPKACKAVSECS